MAACRLNLLLEVPFGGHSIIVPIFSFMAVALCKARFSADDGIRVINGGKKKRLHLAISSILPPRLLSVLLAKCNVVSDNISMQNEEGMNHPLLSSWKRLMLTSPC